MQTTIALTIHHKKPIADLTDKVAGRSYTLAGVDDVNATIAGWMPIESAPKDGTPFIAWDSKEESACFCWWIDDGNEGSPNGYGFEPQDVTHWMPLPQPPKDKL